MMRPTRPNASIREPAVAGYFYPADPAELRDTIDSLLASVVDAPTSFASSGKSPHTYIAPHAGYIYSGGVAAAAYSLLKTQPPTRRKIIVIGPSHRVYLRGIAISQSDAFRTPLGDVPVDAQRKRQLVRRGDVILSEAPHALEHSLEVQLPFLQCLLEGFEILPLVVGDASPAHIASVLSDVFDEAETLIVASSDLSHYLSYEEAQRKDTETNARILAFADDLAGEDACGAVALNGVLTFARRRHATISELARLNSGDTAGDHSRVVGYGAYAIHDAR